MSILQKKAVRIVAAENYNAHTQPIFKSQKILPFDKFIVEVFTQKARQTVVVSVWGARSNAALGMFGLHVRYCVDCCCTFSLCFFLGGGVIFYVDLYFKFKDRFNDLIYYFIC